MDAIQQVQAMLQRWAPSSPPSPPKTEKCTIIAELNGPQYTAPVLVTLTPGGTLTISQPVLFEICGRRFDTTVETTVRIVKVEQQ